MRFLKLSIEWTSSEWLALLSEGGRLSWFYLLTYIKTDGVNGRAKALNPALAARRWFVGEEGVRQMLIAAERDGALTVDEDGYWVLNGWRKHQGDETASERQKRWREKRNETVTAVTERNALRNTESEIEIERENSKSPNKKKSTSEKGNASQNSRPTLASWLAYAQEISYPEHDAQRAFDHYEANGWRQKGGNPIRDWKAACRTCKSRFDEGPKTKPPEPRRTNTLPDSAFLPGGVS